MPEFTLVTYNVHKCIGVDRRYSPERIVQVLNEINADVVALQEVVCHSHLQARDHQADFISAELEMDFRLGETRKHNGGEYGNATFSRFPIEKHRNFDISVSRREPRGCLWTEIDIDAERRIHIMNIHMGTSFFERRLQVHRLLSAHVFDDPEMRGRRIIAGDLNEWTSGLTTKTLRSRFNRVERNLLRGNKATFPGLLPMLELDHIYFDNGFELTEAFIHSSRAARLASDHLPLVARFKA